MTSPQLFVLTGATSGLGLEMARALAQRPESRLLIGARRPEQAHQLSGLRPAGGLAVLPLDLESQESVKQFATAVIADAAGRSIAGVACNAGLETIGKAELTVDGVERTFAANHLGHFALVHRLLPHLAPSAPVISTASGSHNRKYRIGKRLGFRGAVYTDARQVAAGILDTQASIGQQAMDRYATSKLCNILFAFEMARRVPASQARFLAFDPGLVPGTGIVRDRSAFERFGWTNLMPALGFFMAGVSSAERSGRALARLVSAEVFAESTGVHVDYTLTETPTSPASKREDIATDLYDVSIELSGVEAFPRR
jgi:protochlorophyllide reductase